MTDGIESAISVMVVDDEYSIRETVQHHLRSLKYEVQAFESAEDCLEAFREKPTDILITDLRMPGMDGIDLLRESMKVNESTEVIIITAHADKNAAIDALKLGAFDFFEKPITLAALSAAITRTVRYQSAIRERDQLREQVSAISSREAKRWGIKALVGESDRMKEVIKSIRLLHGSADTGVLITGESGTGKELAARAIHFGSGRSGEPFIPVNCAAVPGELAESALFGHIKGAFTGASSDRQGCFDQADRGTLFLDEIGDMTLTMQAKLLRVLEDGLITPVGGARDHKVNVRVIAATNSDLEEKVATKEFREDLYYRLARFTVEMPPLRERTSDIPLLIDYFIGTISDEMGVSVVTVSEEAVQLLSSHGFPGNVRELKNVIERALIESAGDEIGTESIRLRPVSQESEERADNIPVVSSAHDSATLNLADTEAALIKKAMTLADGNVSGAALLLGINRTKLYRKLAAMGEGGG